MKITKILIVATAATSYVSASVIPTPAEDGLHEVTTGKQLFQEVIELFRGSADTDIRTVSDDLDRVKNIETTDKAQKKQVKSLVKQIDHLREEIDNAIKSTWFRKHYRAKTLDKFVNIYIKHQLRKSSSTQIMKLRRTAAAMKAQLETMKMVRDAKVVDLMNYIVDSFKQYEIITPTQSGEVNAMAGEVDQQYFFDTIVLFVRGLAFMMLCSTIEFTACVYTLGSLIAVQIVLWIMVLIRILRGDGV